jgi:hypothetical protein
MFDNFDDKPRRSAKKETDSPAERPRRKSKTDSAPPSSFDKFAGKSRRNAAPAKGKGKKKSAGKGGKKR